MTKTSKALCCVLKRGHELCVYVVVYVWIYRMFCISIWRTRIGTDTRKCMHGNTHTCMQTKHGDSVKDVALFVKDCTQVFSEAVKNGAKIVRAPHVVSDDYGSAVLATIETYGDAVCMCVCVCVYLYAHI